MGKLSPGLMESARWLQLAEMEEAESRPPCSGEMEKSAWGCGGTALGLLRILITCRRDRQCQSLEPRALTCRDRPPGSSVSTHYTRRHGADLSNVTALCGGGTLISSVFPAHVRAQGAVSQQELQKQGRPFVTSSPLMARV